MKQYWPVGLAGIIIALIAFMLAMDDLWLWAILFFILALTVILLPIRRRGTGASMLQGGNMRLCPRNIAIGLAVLGLLVSMIGPPVFGVPLLIAAAAVYFFWPGRRRRRRRR